MKLHYLMGDATHPAYDGPCIICHICNTVGAWGAGFVLSVSKRWKTPEKHYRDLKAYPLGLVQFIPVGQEITVANMVAQEGIGRRNGPAIRYEALKECLIDVKNHIKRIPNASLHMPRIGCGLAGGTWGSVEAILHEVFSDTTVSIYVYDYQK